MGIKDTIQKRAKQEAEQYKDRFIKEQKERHEKKTLEYEDLLTQYYQLEIKLNFLKTMEKHRPEEERNKEIGKLKQQHILLLKKIKDIENVGVLEEYDAFTVAIKDLEQNTFK